ncbi:MAG TPA: O-antigen ligase family protein [Gemmatimonadota bacterium]|nr:O-antigen ligase family protein [Gemmatimonadota bacterium]
MALLAVLVYWVGFSAILATRPPWDMLSALGLCLAAYVLGRLTSRHVTPWALPAAVVVAALAVVLRSPAGSFSHLSAQGFLGYSNAKAAFFVQAAFATVMVFARNRSWKVGACLLPVLVLFLAIPVSSRSLGAFLSSLVILPAIYVAVFRRGHRPLMISAIALVAFAVLSSVSLGRAFSNGISGERESRAAEALDPGRARAWGDAYGILSDRPVLGVGPGGFSLASGNALFESDLRWAHNEFLQVGAELGVVGLLLVLGLFAWTFMRLSSPLAGSSTVAALAVAALALHASVDYLFHFPLLPAVTLALVGSTPLRGPRGSMSQF